MLMASLMVAVALRGEPNMQARYVEPLGRGADQCREWTVQHDLNSAASGAQDQWLAGYLTGFNTFGRSPVRKTSFFRFDVIHVRDAVTSSCRRTPEILVFEAVTQFIESVQSHVRSNR